MSSQSVTAYVSYNGGSKIFTATATDDSWENPLLDSIGSADIGQVMAGTTINNVSVIYANGACLARVADRTTLAVKRTFTGAKAGATDYASTACQPYTIQPNDILVAYPIASDATANQTAVVGWLTMSRGTVAFGASDIPDSTATEITSLVNNQSLGTYYGQSLTGIKISAEDGAALSLVTVIGPNGGTLLSIPATTRAAAGSGDYYYNLDASKLNIKIEKGTVIKVATITAS